MTDDDAAQALARILGPGWQAEPVGQDQAYPTELTPIGEQLVIPGCEKQPKPGKVQLGLWD